MSEAPPSQRSRESEAPSGSDDAFELDDRFANLGRAFGERERDHVADIRRARTQLERLHAAVSAALEAFDRGARSAGVSHFGIELSEIRTDDKHLRALEFELVRGRHCAIVTAKSRGEVTLVGPFRKGKNEGPCRSFPFDAAAELRGALTDFLEKFLEAAATP